MTMRYASIRHRDLLVLALTACGAIAGPALGVAGATPDLPLAIAAIVLTAMLAGVVPRHRVPLLSVPVPAGHRGPPPPTWASP